jgi:CheY-like chemotaxis protein
MDTIPEAPAKILVINDNNDEVQELREALTECGEPYELSILQGWRRSPSSCVIVLDLNLPKHDALAVLAAIRSEPALSHIKVLVLGTMAEPETQALLRAMGGLYRETPRDLPGVHDMALQLLVLCNKQRPFKVYPLNGQNLRVRRRATFPRGEYIYC